MKNPAQLIIKGIKCDNPNCDYREEVEIKDIKDCDKWLNKQCPKCGQNLFTQNDYVSLKILTMFTDLLNAILPKGKDDEKPEVFSVKMNGSGKVVFEKKQTKN